MAYYSTLYRAMQQGSRAHFAQLRVLATGFAALLQWGRELLLDEASLFENWSAVVAILSIQTGLQHCTFTPVLEAC
ncbi:hypothetical protein [Aeromonas veronii]|uniref:hypothetical protein n=1 Tax=Aeromonas veronii TaxID=654 RepID=UPI0015E62CA2|nr:hypothetical protein [Aeromonas veronii]MBA2082216.1 hypothetical protein [Aeromonas veronii]